MKDATEIVVVMDKSGSMAARQADAIGGFNTFLKEQQELPGEANLTLILFDTTYAVVYSGKPIKAVEQLSPETYRPGGNTALLDALARGIIETGDRLSKIAEADRPSKVICVVITDGEENSSQEHTREKVKEMVEHQEKKYNWAFLYLGANVDAFANAQGLGIAPQNAVMYAACAIGTRSAYQGTSEAVKHFRTSGKKGLADNEANWKSKVKSS